MLCNIKGAHEHTIQYLCIRCFANIRKLIIICAIALITAARFCFSLR